jgi:HD-GYP domain-containing protein (c-di-GMP phosphodiesterase class II)
MNHEPAQFFVLAIMPFHREYQDIYTLGIKAACEDAGARCERVDEQIFSEDIMTRLLNNIMTADLIIADVSERNPNVFYEVGLAHAMRKTVVFLTRREEDIPFDLKHYPHIVYTFNIDTLRAKLRDHLLELLRDNRPKGMDKILKWQPPRFEAEWTAFLEARAEDELIDRIVEGWAKSAELRRYNTEGHTARLAEQTVELARALGVGEDEIIHYRRGALLHDLGTINLPDATLSKFGKLSEKDLQAFREHPIIAYELLFPLPILRKAVDIPRYHHELWDGSGYPSGLAGENIPLSARIFTVVNIFEAFTVNRGYKMGMAHDQALDEIARLSGTHLDPRVVEVFLALHRSR